MRECPNCDERAVDHDGICEECGHDITASDGTRGLFEFPAGGGPE